MPARSLARRPEPHKCSSRGRQVLHSAASRTTRSFRHRQPYGADVLLPSSARSPRCYSINRLYVSNKIKRFGIPGLCACSEEVPVSRGVIMSPRLGLFSRGCCFCVWGRHVCWSICTRMRSAIVEMSTNGPVATRYLTMGN